MSENKKKLNPILFWVLSLTWGLPMTLFGVVVAIALIVTGYKPKRSHRQPVVKDGLIFFVKVVDFCLLIWYNRGTKNERGVNREESEILCKEAEQQRLSLRQRV